MSTIKVRLHHVGILVKDIREAAAAYTRRFGYEVKSEILHDAVQTAYMQFLQLPGESSYLELVSPDRPQSKLSTALLKGGGLHHVCYTTDQIDGLCEKFCAEGMSLIQPPLPAVGFAGRRIAWLMGPDRTLTELAEEGPIGGTDPGVKEGRQNAGERQGSALLT